MQCIFKCMLQTNACTGQIDISSTHLCFYKQSQHHWTTAKRPMANMSGFTVVKVMLVIAIQMKVHICSCEHTHSDTGCYIWRLESAADQRHVYELFCRKTSRSASKHGRCEREYALLQCLYMRNGWCKSKERVEFGWMTKISNPGHEVSNKSKWGNKAPFDDWGYRVVPNSKNTVR